MAEGKNIRIRLIKAELTLMWLWEETKKKGFGTVDYVRFTRIMNGKYTGGSSRSIFEAAEEILQAKEEEIIREKIAG